MPRTGNFHIATLASNYRCQKAIFAGWHLLAALGTRTHQQFNLKTLYGGQRIFRPFPFELVLIFQFYRHFSNAQSILQIKCLPSFVVPPSLICHDDRKGDDAECHSTRATRQDVENKELFED